MIGTAAIGVELAQAFARLRVDVTLFECDSALSAGRTPEVKSALKADLKVVLGHDPAPEMQSGSDKMSWVGESEKFDYILLAAGRPRSIDALNLAATGATLDDKGTANADPETLQIEDLPIFMAGDVTGQRQVLHEVSTGGTIAGRNAARFPDVSPSALMVSFGLTFCDPPVAAIGSITDDAAHSATASYADQGRAKVEGNAHGLAQLHADAGGVLIGVDLCCPAGEHLAHLLT